MSKELSLAIKIGGKVDSSLNSAFSAVKSGISGAAKAMAAATAAGVAAVGTLTSKAIDVGSTFEQSMSQVQATMLIDRTTAEGAAAYETLENAARQCGRETAFSATEASEGLNYLALAGYSAEKAAAALPTVLRLAGAGAMDLAAASDMVTDAMSALGIEATQTNLESFADKMAKTASISNTSVAQLGEAILAVGGTAKGLAGGTTELNAALGILADNGIKAAEGGTHLRNMLLSLQSPRNSDAAALFEKLGLSAYDAAGNMRSMGLVFGDLNRAMSGWKASDVNNVLSTIFKQTDLAAARAMLAATADSVQSLGTIVDASLAQNGQSLAQLGINLSELANSFDSTMSSEQFAAQMMQQYGMDAESAGVIFEGLSSIVNGTGNRFDELTTKINDSVGACQEMYNIQLDNLKGDLSILNSAAEDLYITIFKEINPGLRSAVQMGQEMLGKLAAAFDAGGLSGMVGAVGEVIADAINAATSVAPKVVQMGVDLVTSFVQGISLSAGQLGNAASTIGSAFVQGMFELFPTVILTGIDAAISFADGIADGLPGITASGTQAIGGFVDGLIARGPKVFETALTLAKVVANEIVQNAPQLIKSGATLIAWLITGLADGLSNNAPEIIQTIGVLTETVSKALIEAAPQLIEAGGKLISAAGKGIANSAKSIFEGIGNGSISGSQAAAMLLPIALAAQKVIPILGQAKGAVSSLLGTLLSAGNKVKSVAQIFIGFPTKLTSALEQAKGTISGFVGVFSSIGGRIKTATQAIIGFPTMAKNFVTAAGGMRNAIGVLAKGGISKIGGIFKAIISPAGIVIAVIAALTAAFIHLWNTNEGFRNAITAIWNQIVNTIKNFSQNIKTTLSGLGIDFQAILSGLGSGFQKAKQVISVVWNGLCELLAPVFVGAFQYIADFLASTLNMISGIVKMFVSVFRGDWSGCWEAAKGIVSGTWKSIKSTINNFGSTICGVVNAFLKLIGSDWAISWDAIHEKLSNVWGMISGVVNGALNGIKNAIKFIMNLIHGDWSGSWEKIRGAATKAVSSIPNALSSGWELLKRGISGIGDTIGSLLDAGWTTLKDTAVSFVTGIPGAIASGWETLKSGISSVGDAIGPLLDTGWQTIKDNATAAAEALPELVSEGFDTLVSNISGIGSNLGGLLDEGWDLLKGAAETAASAVQKAWEGVKNFFGGLWDAITGGGDSKEVSVSVPTVDTSALENQTQMQIQVDAAQVETANAAIKTLNDSLSALKEAATIEFKINTQTLTDLLKQAGSAGGKAFTTALTSAINAYKFDAANILPTAKMSLAGSGAGRAGGTALGNGINTAIAAYSFKPDATGMTVQIMTLQGQQVGRAGGEVLTQMLALAIQNGSGAVTGAIAALVAELNSALNSGWELAKSSAQSAMEALQRICASGSAAAANVVRSAFANLRITIPKPSIPVINVSTSSIAYGKGGSVSIPHFSVSWNALGGIFDSPTVLPTMRGMQGFGEAGAEAILPLDTLWSRMKEIMDGILADHTQGIIGNVLEKLRGADKTQQNTLEVAGTGMTVNFSPTYVLQGSATKEDAKEAAKMTFQEFKKMMEQYDRENQRKKLK